MRRLHVHLNVAADQFDATTAFYSTLFGHEPTKTRDGYAKWMLDDPRVNFVAEVPHECCDSLGIHHVGLQVDGSDELEDIRRTLKAADAPLLEVGETVCCYSKSEKHWTRDPSGVRWEAFHTHGDAEDYGDRTVAEREGSSCCV